MPTAVTAVLATALSIPPIILVGVAWSSVILMPITISLLIFHALFISLRRLRQFNIYYNEVLIY